MSVVILMLLRKVLFKQRLLQNDLHFRINPNFSSKHKIWINQNNEYSNNVVNKSLQKIYFDYGHISDNVFNEEFIEIVQLSKIVWNCIEQQSYSKQEIFELSKEMNTEIVINEFIETMISEGYLYEK